MGTESKWNDDVMKAIGHAHATLNFLNIERSQLYGALIHLMMLLGQNSVEFPTPEEIQTYGDNYYIVFNTDDNRIELKEQEKDDGQA